MSLILQKDGSFLRLK